MSAAGLRRRVDRLQRIPETTTRDAAAAVIKIARDVGARYGPLTMGRRGRRVPLGATTRVRGAGQNMQATVWGKPTGPWVWVTTGAAGHQIPRTSRRRGGKPRYLSAPGYAHPIGRPVQHPGRSGRGAWTQVQAQARAKVPDVYRDAVRAVLGGP